MPTIREQFVELEGAIQEVFDAYFSKKTDYNALMYNVQQSKRSQENHLGTGVLGQMTEWQGKVAYQEFSKGYESTYRHAKYSIGLEVEREVMIFEEYAKIKNRTDKIAHAVHKTLQSHGASTFNKAFSTEILGPDGKPLASATHSNVPGDEAQSNTGVLALTVDNLETVMINMSQFKDDKGDRLDVMGNTLIVGDYWRKTAQQIVGSELEPFTGENQTNFYADENLKVLYNPWITGKKWFLADRDLMKQSLNWYNVPGMDPRKINYVDDFDTEMGKYKSVGMWSKGWDNWWFLFGNNPA